MFRVIATSLFRFIVIALKILVMLSFSLSVLLLSLDSLVSSVVFGNHVADER